jgi:membrane associated rhomboid family serine protease
MSSRYRYRFGNFGFPRWTPVVRILIITCVVAYFLQIFDRASGGPSLTYKFGLTPSQVTHNFYLWQLVTYMFLHGGTLHILFNMLGLWMFGSELESLWGPRYFTKFYFICGIAAGLLTVLLSPNSTITTIGASGAIYGILAAFGILFPNRIIIFIIFPIPAKWFVLGLGVMAFLSSFTESNGVANVAHLGGMLCGLLYLKGGSLVPGLKYRYDRWHRNRLRRKFEVYYNERHRKEDDPERWRRWKN